MKFMVLIYENPGTRERFAADDGLRAAMNDYVAELQASGEFLGGEGLADPSTARLIRMETGMPVTDGPFMESKEYFGGYMLLDCDGIDRATEIARGFPAAPLGGALEVRPLMDGGGAED
jgi:hypothetical protein